MKRIAFLLLFICVSSHSHGQNSLEYGERQWNLGMGIQSVGVPLYFGIDFGILPDISIGGQVAQDLEFNYLTMSGRGDYHFNRLLNIINQFDIYAGMNLGVDIGLEETFDSGLNIGFQIGGRYFWNDTWAVNLEIGGSNSYSGGRAGVTRKF